MPASSERKTFACISTYFKGEDFIRACKAEGNTVLLVTLKKLENEAWPRECLDELFLIDGELKGQRGAEELIGELASLMRNRKIDRVVALDDFDVEKATLLREHFRLPGMGQTTGRYFRDKLAMRLKARSEGIPVPAFSALFNDGEIDDYLRSVEPPWLVKPRSEAAVAGIRKVGSREEAWDAVSRLGAHRHQYLIEKFAPGDVYHADSLSMEGEVVFCRVSRYLSTPMEVAHGGGVFRSHTVEFGEEDDRALRALNARVMQAFGMKHSASHTEFIKSRESGEFCFLETSSRVGGAHLAEMVEASSGINLWREWARIESAVANDEPYRLPETRRDHAGIVVSLSRYRHPDTSGFTDPEIVWRLNKDYHVGLVLRSDRRRRILDLLDSYTGRIFRDLHASLPAPERQR